MPGICISPPVLGAWALQVKTSEAMDSYNCEMNQWMETAVLLTSVFHFIQVWND